MSIVHITRRELAARPIAEAITARGHELSASDTVADARRIFAGEAVRVLPLLVGTTYVGAVDREAIAVGVPGGASVVPFATTVLPTAFAATPANEALAALDRAGSTRLVVIDDDRAYVGLVCLRSDRDRLCVDADLPRTEPLTKGHPQ